MPITYAEKMPWNKASAKFWEILHEALPYAIGGLVGLGIIIAGDRIMQGGYDPQIRALQGIFCKGKSIERTSKEDAIVDNSPNSTPLYISCTSCGANLVVNCERQRKFVVVCPACACALHLELQE